MELKYGLLNNYHYSEAELGDKIAISNIHCTVVDFSKARGRQIRICRKALLAEINARLKK